MLMCWSSQGQLLHWLIGSRCRYFVFFFSSRRRHTRFDCDWSSDVCSSDLAPSGCTLDFTQVSASGQYVIVHFEGDWQQVLDVDPNTLALTPRPMPAAAPRCNGTAAQGFIYDLGHPDVTLNPFDNNEDVIIGQEHCGNIGKTVNGRLMGGGVMVRLRGGAVTSLNDPTNEAYPYHISARNLDRPGRA